MSRNLGIICSVCVLAVILGGCLGPSSGNLDNGTTPTNDSESVNEGLGETNEISPYQEMVLREVEGEINVSRRDVTVLAADYVPRQRGFLVLEDDQEGIIETAIEDKNRIPNNENTSDFRQMLSEFTQPKHVMSQEDIINPRVYVYYNGTYYRLTGE